MQKSVAENSNSRKADRQGGLSLSLFVRQEGLEWVYLLIRKSQLRSNGDGDQMEQVASMGKWGLGKIGITARWERWPGAGRSAPPREEWVQERVRPQVACGWERSKDEK